MTHDLTSSTVRSGISCKVRLIFALLIAQNQSIISCKNSVAQEKEGTTDSTTT